MNMTVNYQTDKGGRLQSVTIYPLDTAKPTLELPEDFDLKNIRDYVLQGGALIREPYVPAPSAAEQIAALKQKLAETDYIAAKTVDLLIGAESLSALLTVLAETRSEYREILGLRGVWRQKIRELKAAESNQNKEV